MMSCYPCKIDVVNAKLTKDGKTAIIECIVDDGKEKHVAKFWENPSQFKDVLDGLDKFNAECIIVNFQYKITKRL